MKVIYRVAITDDPYIIVDFDNNIAYWHHGMKELNDLESTR